MYGINDFVGKERKNISLRNLHCMSTDGRLVQCVKGF